MQQDDTSKKTDRRNYFRIDDVSILYHRPLQNGEASAQGLPDKLSIDKLTLKARFEYLTREIKPLCKTIEENNPKLAQYLSAIDAKLNMLSEVLMDTVVDDLDKQPQKVNISAGGLSFDSDSALTPGSVMELCVVLLPTNVGIYSHARVVSCKKDADSNEAGKIYKVAVEFIKMDDEFRDLISRHVLKREQAELVSGHLMES